MHEARLDRAAGRRIQDWSSEELRDEIAAALAEFAGPERVMDEASIELFAVWFHNDRELAGGATPAELYAARTDLTDDERARAARIAAARLGLYRVLAVEPGRSLVLEALVGGRRVEVQSPLVSRDAIRWDILLSRVMDGPPPTLWGAVRFFEPSEEPELRAELARLAGIRPEELGERPGTSPYGRHALELLRFVPRSRSAEPTFFTVEGDPVVVATATWRDV